MKSDVGKTISKLLKNSLCINKLSLEYNEI